MTTPGSRAEELRREFDRAFGEPVLRRDENLDELLAISAGGQAYAISLGEIQGLYRDKRITPLPGAPDGLLGVATFRGNVLPVYDLARAVGHVGRGVVRWLVTSRTLVAFAFERFDGHLRVPRGTTGSVDFAGTTRPIIRLSPIVEQLEARVRDGSRRRSADDP